VVNDTDLAVNVLRNNDRVVKVTQLLAVYLQNKPGSFAEIVRLLADNGIGVEYAYAFTADQSADVAKLVLRVGDNDKASEILKNAGFTV